LNYSCLNKKTILSTRPLSKLPQVNPDPLGSALKKWGAQVAYFAALEIAPLEDFTELDAALQQISEFDWVVFTSSSGAAAAAERMMQLDLPLHNFDSVKIAAVGTGTGKIASLLFHIVDAIPHSFKSSEIAQILGDIRGQKILLLRALLARKELADDLKSLGALVSDVTTYRSTRPTDLSGFPSKMPDAIVFMSSEAARSVADICTKLNHTDWMTESKLICIGPVTADTVRELGFQPAAIAKNATIRSLVEATISVFDSATSERLAEVNRNR